MSVRCDLSVAVLCLQLTEAVFWVKLSAGLLAEVGLLCFGMRLLAFGSGCLYV